MYCKHCGKKMSDGSKTCPFCGKRNGSDVLKIVLAALVGVLLVSVLVLAVYVGTNGWPDFGSTESTGGQVESPATTPTDGNPDDVTCKGTYSVDNAAALAAKDTVVAVMGEYELTNGQLQIYYWMQVVDFLNYWGSYASYFGLDYTKPLDQQIYDQETGQSWQQYFLQSALDNWHRDHALYLEAEKNGYVMDSEYQEYLDGLREGLEESAKENGFASVDEMLQTDMGAAADYAGYEYYLNRYYKGNLYFNDHYTDVTVTDKEIEDYFTEHADELKSSYDVTKESGIVADLQYILFYPEGATKDTIGKETFDQAAWDAALKKAQDMLQSWIDGGAKAEDFEKLVEEAADEKNTSGSGGSYDGLSNYSMSGVDVRHVLIQPEGGTKDANNNTTYTDAEWEACRQKAQALLDAWVAGGATEEAFITMAKENSADGNAEDGGIYSDVTKDYMVAEFDAWIFDESREYGDYGLVKTQFGYHIMFFVHGDTAFDRWSFAPERQAGDYGIVKTDGGYYLLRYEGGEEGWIRYSRLALQSEKMAEDAIALYPLEVDYTKIALAVVDMAG